LRVLGKAAAVNLLGGFAVIDVHDFRNNSGSLATLAAIRRASSLVSSLAADRRPSFSSITK
jgi:hypothetical protein